MAYIDPTKEVFTFGKHKGSTFEQVMEAGNASYIIWVSENINKYKNRIPKEFILKCKDNMYAERDASGCDWADNGFDINDFGNN